MNLFESDTITVTGKKQAADDIIKCYGDFGWRLTENKEDRLYADIKHMTFTRPHFIESKDELQLLQVRLEIAFNSMGKLARKINNRAALLVTLVFFITAAFVCGGVFLILYGGLVPVISGAVICALGAAVAAAGGISANRVYKKDKVKYTYLIENELQKIENLCNRAKELRGGV